MLEDIFAGPLRLLMTVGILMAAAFVVMSVLKLRSGSSGTRVRGFPYARRSGLFTEAEARFWRVLREAVPEMEVFGKVRLEDVIVVRSGLSKSDRATARNRIKSRHLDFVLIDPKSTRVLVVVELDDASHNSARARQADAFKDQALEAAGVPIVRVRASASYDAEELAALVRTAVDPVAAPDKPINPEPIVPFVPG